MAKEIIISKCFEATYFSWFDVDHNVGNAYAELVYASTASKARYKFFLGLNIETYTYDFNITKIKVRRCRSMDLLHREPHLMLSEITETQLHKMQHAVGFDPSKDWHHLLQHTFYRNRYIIPSDDDFNDLVKKGLALSNNSPLLHGYHLTAEGKEVIISLMPIKRFHKEATYPKTTRTYEQVHSE